MENFKIDLIAFLKKLKAYACMFLYSCLAVAMFFPLWITLAVYIDISIPVILIICGIMLLFCIIIFYFNSCKKCINNTVNEICKECRMKKLNICQNEIKQRKQSNYEEACRQINRILAEKEKVSNMKKSESTNILNRHFDDELKRWTDIKEKNKI